MRKLAFAVLLLVLSSFVFSQGLYKQLEEKNQTLLVLPVQAAIMLSVLAGITYYLKKKTISLVLLGLASLGLFFSMFFPLLLSLLVISPSCGCNNDCLYVNHPELRPAIDEIRDANNTITLKDAASILFIMGTISLAKHDPKSKNKQWLMISVVLFLIALTTFSFFLYKASVIDVVSPSLHVLVLNDSCCISGCM